MKRAQAEVDSAPRTMLEKIWDLHTIEAAPDGWTLLHIDRHLLHDLSGPPALEALAARGLDVHDPALTMATPDHAVSTSAGRTSSSFEPGRLLYDRLAQGAQRAGIRMFDLDSGRQGIVHVIAPELGLVQPGATLVCGDSHTCTNGGIGALAFGVGQSESAHVLATQTLRLRRPRAMRVSVEGTLAPGVSAKDLALYLLSKLGARAGIGHAIEYSGSAIRALDVEARLTLCNLSIELGARSGFIAPDDTVFSYLQGRPYSPRGASFDAAVTNWRELASDQDARFDFEVTVDAAEVAPRVSWGTSPDQSVAIDEVIPYPSADGSAAAEMHDALRYMGLVPGQKLSDLAVDRVFIGSCANSRLSDLREAAALVSGRSVAQNVRAWVVPGSESVSRAAIAEGLDRVFTDAGFEWREPGCSMCVAANGETVPPGARSVSTSNRNFIGRQGPGARTHLASPATAAASAIAGHIADARRFP